MNRGLRTAGSLGRTARKADENDNPLERARAAAAAFLGIKDPQRLAIVPGCTWASNIAIQSLPWKAGDRIIHSGLEHNSASRPCRLVGERHGVEVFTAPYQPGNPMDLDFVEDLLRHKRVKLVVATMASNITGELLPWRELRRLTREHGAMLMLDAAQTAGVVPIDIGELQPDMMVFAGHKGLYGPPGIGLLYVAPGVEHRFFAVGGTGHDSGKLDMSARMPAMFEVGTFNGPAIAGLEAGIAHVQSVGTDAILRHERQLTARFLAGLAAIEGVHVYGDPDPEKRLSVVSCRFLGRDPKTVSGWLAERGIVTRAGFHCAPLAHQTIGSHPFGGTVRFSFGHPNTLREVDHVLAVLAQMPADLGRFEATLPCKPGRCDLDFEI
jgi:selenocysteine lyase/cysteine desulfurase